MTEKRILIILLIRFFPLISRNQLSFTCPLCWPNLSPSLDFQVSIKRHLSSKFIQMCLNIFGKFLVLVNAQQMTLTTRNVEVFVRHVIAQISEAVVFRLCRCRTLEYCRRSLRRGRGCPPQGWVDFNLWICWRDVKIETCTVACTSLWKFNAAGLWISLSSVWFSVTVQMMWLFAGFRLPCLSTSLCCMYLSRNFSVCMKWLINWQINQSKENDSPTIILLLIID